MLHPTLFLSLALAGSALSVPAPSQDYTQSFGQVVFENRTDTIGHLWVDDEYGCGPVLVNFFCVTQVEAGEHSAHVRFDDGEVVSFGAIYVEPGEIVTLTVNMPPPPSD